jgi:hypothetical protein
MSSRFSEWFNRIVGNNLDQNDTKVSPTISIVSEEPILPHETPETPIRQSDYEAYSIYSARKRNLHMQKALKQIRDYDAKKAASDPNYKSLAYNCEHEVDAKDEDAGIDKALDIEQQKKLGIYSGVEDISDARKKELQEQKDKFDARQKERESALHAMRNKLSVYDTQQAHREGYKSYEQHCKDNEQNSDQEEDDEMDRVLMEKLGVYDEEDESDTVRQRRLKKQQAIDKKIATDKRSKEDNVANVIRQMDAYHEANKHRKGYRRYRHDPIDENNTTHLFKRTEQNK